MAVAPLEDIGLAEDVMPLGHLLLRSARRDPDKDALVFPDRRVSLPRAGGHVAGASRARCWRSASSPASTSGS